MTSKKRQKELARAKMERQAARRAEAARRTRRRQRFLILGLVIALVVATTGGLLLTTIFDDDETAADAPPDLSTGEQPVAACSAPGIPVAEPLSFEQAEEVVADGEAIALTLNTNCGPIGIKTRPGRAPSTVNSMTFLAESGYFDRTICHRLTTEGLYVLQCGDPTGTGSGGPGYTIDDENLPTDAEVTYPAGTVAMANSGPDTNGSQFFIVYEDSPLPPGYSIWGEVVEGLDIVTSVAEAGVVDGGPDGAPAQTVMIDTVSVIRG